MLLSELRDYSTMIVSNNTAMGSRAIGYSVFNFHIGIDNEKCSELCFFSIRLFF